MAKKAPPQLSTINYCYRLLIDHRTRRQAYFHRSLTVPEHFKLRQRYFVGHAHRVWSLVPFIPDVPHRVSN